MGEEIECSKCEKIYEKDTKHGRVCRDCRNAMQRERRRKVKDKYTKKYERTKKGYLMRTYRNMLSRVKGIQKKSICSYLHLDLLSKEEFYKWSLDNPDFHEIFEAWEKSNYSTKLGPSIDRIDPREGYYLLNMQWVTRSENSIRAGAFRYHNRII